MLHWWQGNGSTAHEPFPCTQPMMNTRLGRLQAPFKVFSMAQLGIDSSLPALVTHAQHNLPTHIELHSMKSGLSVFHSTHVAKCIDSNTLEQECYTHWGSHQHCGCSQRASCIQQLRQCALTLLLPEYLDLNIWWRMVTTVTGLSVTMFPWGLLQPYVSQYGDYAPSEH